MKINMRLSKKTKNYLVYSQTIDGETTLEDKDAVIGKLYLKANEFKESVLITVTITGEK